MIKPTKNVMILSGAGLSAPSGLKTFRDTGGLWEEYDVMEVCSDMGFLLNPKKVLDFYDKRRIQLADVAPNHAHKVIAALKQRYAKNLFVVTQNVDDLLERAGCAGVIHLHGFLPELICQECGHIINIGHEKMGERVCQKCGKNRLRHNIVMFGEAAPEYATLHSLLKETDLFVSIGTSGEVLPVGQYAKMCPKSILNIWDETSDLPRYFGTTYNENILSAIDKIEKDIEKFMES